MVRIVTDKEIDEMIQLKREGKTNEEIAKELNRNKQTVRKYLKNQMDDYDKFNRRDTALTEVVYSKDVITILFLANKGYYICILLLTKNLKKIS
jgi:IS30 family transposase